MTKWKIENVDSPPPPTSTCSTFVHWTVKWYAEKSANKLIRKRISSHQSVCSIVPPARENNWILSRKVSSEKHGFIHIDWHRYRFCCFAAAQSLFREELFARFQLLFLVTEVCVHSNSNSERVVCIQQEQMPRCMTLVTCIDNNIPSSHLSWFYWSKMNERKCAYVSKLGVK